MSIAGAIFLIAAGAILRFAVQDEIEAVNLETVGLILMIAGVAALVLTFAWQAQARRRGDVVYERPVDRPPPP